jgi:uncharacterized Zn-finger protein
MMITKNFIFLNILERHLSFHISKKPSKCDYCGKEYRYFTQLKEHVRLHTGEMPYECEYCQKRFRLNSTLIVSYFMFISITIIIF